MLLVLVEEDSGAVAGSSLEALTLARGVAESTGDTLHAVAFGSHDYLAKTLAQYGASTLHLLEGTYCADYAPECWGAYLAQLLERTDANAVFAAGTDRGNEVLAHAAAHTGQPFASNCVEITAGEPWTLTRTRGGGMLLEDAEISGATKFIGLATGAAEATEAAQASDIDVESFAPELAEDFAHSEIVERTSRGTGVSLATARVIVSGGRGVGSAEGFAGLEELAELLGGAVGCSRVATNNGWRSHSDQVGQTGTKIAADLYIACGISGATQHWVGCMGAKTILAINTDPEAPLVTRSDYAIIADVHDVLPAVIERVKARKQLPGAA